MVFLITPASIKAPNETRKNNLCLASVDETNTPDPSISPREENAIALPQFLELSEIWRERESQKEEDKRLK